MGVEVHSTIPNCTTQGLNKKDVYSPVWWQFGNHGFCLGQSENTVCYAYELGFNLWFSKLS